MSLLAGESVRYPFYKVGPDADGTYTLFDADGKRVAARVSPLVADQFAAAPAMLIALEAFGVLSCTPEWQNRRLDAVRKARGGAA